MFRSLYRLQCVQNSLARIVANHSCKKESSLVAYQAWLCFSRWPYWCTSLYMVVNVQNNLNLSLNLDKVCKQLVEVNPMACCLRSYTLYHYISLKSILASALHMMPQGFGMTCLMTYAQPNLSLHSGRS